MATGKELKRLRGSISAQEAATFIGVDVERLRKWEQRDADPKDSGDVLKVEKYFGCSLADLTKLETFQWKTKPPETGAEVYREKYFSQLEKYARVEEELQAVKDNLSQMSVDMVALTRKLLEGQQEILRQIAASGKVHSKGALPGAKPERKGIHQSGGK